MDSQDQSQAGGGVGVAAHTPGPWEACEPGAYGDFGGNSQVILGADMRIAVVHWDPHAMRLENEANARLIAAAPDGLEAAQDTYVKLLSLHQIRHLFQAEMCALRDFIAKATGNEPQVVQDSYEALVGLLHSAKDGTTERSSRSGRDR